MHTLRTRFKKDIVAEFLPPSGSQASHSYKERVVIFCDGLPSVPSKRSLLEFFSKKGYWVFHPRYRGTWESGGRFLKKSPHEDILDVISALSGGFRDFWSNKKYTVRPDHLYVIGSSFGGTAAILASGDPRVTKAVAIAPVVDWTRKSRAEPIDWLAKFTKRAFGQGYRFSHSDWRKLEGGKFYNPFGMIERINGTKLLIIHANDDDVVSFKPVKTFAKHTGCTFVPVKKGGHLSSSILLKKRFYRRFQEFIKKKM
ncbi:MAG: hypothetical protein A3C80_01140 [Candidatus Ryanbacteria bacterium RIFCSPHIGHO2_02_FULL_45_43]|uniref:Peptidase S9 prolyl oligopeptidase catalytic domain-containing protein n=1 Tax=Candidatus Ryanbacteria bacterium RIFCSPHIGHO2_01_45_13 TaxID=1802112 RepID=A0A1G2FXS0_9BACT|nr:MAG: hypothetical protein A2718_03370 [Candidatus Ryanbacteria bacterium RIFCSPHIGHO2_01_FULL_44_130]OGZ42875.1 MAG: hypothetical protein A2W41_02005 [Candidatus Ryanbacteria bacterium RIFCSPHIGHO2_01_45_13]OGZ48131.1 MAG: hypothetical protein A3C80_01140 [Candidatus Ryanbacteria bacterium RIFCSPHIGHO2_02_FULL_45_43]OGZ49779.1 MAG: hypothetical protein A3E55_00965 [Candidatus Ryanbacteria bacterium RIFCSPHIGHO2_12_FULL_44_20]OGZ51205.1 MAG: hypothetical protein A3A17_04175 [Candidatus Ryanba